LRARRVLSAYQQFEDATVTDPLTATADPNALAAIAEAASSHTDVAAILGLTIPIVAIVLGLGVAMLGMWLDYRKKREMYQLHHAERMAAIEKGIDLPPLPLEFFQGHKHRDVTPFTYLRRGMMWSLIGVAVTVALWGTGRSNFWWGLVPTGVGVAYLLSYLVERNRKPPSTDVQRPQ
jgi:hypothetical protein